MKTPKFWATLNPISIALYPISMLYRVVSKVKFHLQKPYKFKTRIICIGNINAGGSGKTPAAIAVGKLLQKKGYKIAYACKNYLGSIDKPIHVNNKFSSLEVLDEAILLSKIAPTFVAKSRKSAIAMADKLKVDFIIADDGMQNNTFYKDISILVLNKKIGIGNGFLLPAGPLRESLKSGMRKADIVFDISMSFPRRREPSKTNTLALDTSLHVGDRIGTYLNKKEVPTFTLKQVPLSKQPKDMNYIAFSGIAYPPKFFNTLSENRFNLTDRLEYPDHYNYKQEEIEYLISKAWKLGAQLITTEKDLVRIDKKYHKYIECFKIKLKIKNKEQLLRIIEAL